MSHEINQECLDIIELVKNNHKIYDETINYLYFCKYNLDLFVNYYIEENNGCENIFLKKLTELTDDVVIIYSGDIADPLIREKYIELIKNLFEKMKKYIEIEIIHEDLDESNDSVNDDTLIEDK